MEVPAQLLGSREAIFYLLRQTQVEKEARIAPPAGRPSVRKVQPCILTRKTVAAPVQEIDFLGYIQGDQFEFFSTVSTGIATRNHARA